jgi:hypothetical protein
MDNQQVADQLKLAVKWSVRNRFWIALGFSALLPMIGYLIGSAPIKEDTKKEVTKIKGADSGVKPYTQPGIANAQYKPLIDEKKEVLTQDVNKAWDKLYARQAPLLSWPPLVAEKFRTWGRKWPEGVDLSVVQRAITDYVGEYEKAVDDTYKKVNPWDPIAGTGIVEVPDKAILLQPAVFDVAQPPDLGKVWAAQEKLWIQGTLLDAIAKINGPAKTWDEAVVKRLDLMEVGTPAAQDQKSMVKGQTVKIAPEILAPGQVSASATTTTPGTPGVTGAASGSGSSAFGAAATAAQDLYYIESPSQAYSLLPIRLTALVDQNRLQEFFIGLENSPMAIQVMEFELLKPINPITKPVKLEGTPGVGGMPGMAGMGRAGSDEAMRRGPGGMMGSGGRSNMGMMIGGGGGGNAPKGKNVRDVVSARKKEREEKEKMLKALGRAIDTYYDIVEVTVYGQARFYNPPPPAPAEPATAATSPAPAEDPSKAATKPATEPAKAEDAAKAETKPANEPAKTEDAAKPVTEPAKAEAKPGDASKPAETAKKDEAKPADTTKPGNQPKR